MNVWCWFFHHDYRFAYNHWNWCLPGTGKWLPKNWYWALRHISIRGWSTYGLPWRHACSDVPARNLAGTICDSAPVQSNIESTIRTSNNLWIVDDDRDVTWRLWWRCGTPSWRRGPRSRKKLRWWFRWIRPVPRERPNRRGSCDHGSTLT